MYKIAGWAWGDGRAPGSVLGPAYQGQHTGPFSCSVTVPPRCPRRGSKRLRSLKMNGDDKRNHARVFERKIRLVRSFSKEVSGESSKLSCSLPWG